MKIISRYGNILDTDAKYICHCVNAQGVMGSGVAKAIRDKYPKAFNVYRKEYESRGRLSMGYVIGADCDKHIILNLVGQKYYGNEPGKCYLDYIALRKGISSINKYISEPVAFPMIGCGLAGGDWKVVSEILEEESTNFQPLVYVLDDRIPF